MNKKLIIFILVLNMIFIVKSDFNFIFNEKNKQELNNIDNYNKKIYIENILKSINQYWINPSSTFFYNYPEVTKQIANCPCNCNFSSIGILDGNGYGRYCGIKYTCVDTYQPGCDAVDACCRVHDICVGNAGGYCNTCDCNINLVNCLNQITTYKSNCGDPIEKKAQYTIIDDICYILKYGPSWCGACSANYTIPSICN